MNFNAETQTKTLAAATPVNFDFGALGARRARIVIRNTGAQSITAVAVGVSPAGTYFGDITPVTSAVGTIAASSSAMIDVPVCGTTLRVTLTSTSGSTAVVEVCLSDTGSDSIARVNGNAIGGQSSTGNVAGDTASFGGAANASAILTLLSTTKGLLLPVMTTTQRDAISSPAEGLVIYNVTTHKLNVRVAAAWEAVTSA